jgi:hypothetical protein
MPNEVLRKSGDCILFAKSTVAPGAANVLASTYTRYDLDLSATVTTASSRQSAKADLGAKRAPAYNVYACIEFATAPTSGAAIEFYWAPSPVATAANGNTGGASGSDGAYTGPASGTDDGGVKKIQFIGQMACENIGNAVQIAFIGTFSPSSRYGSLIVKNECGQTLFTTDAYEHQVLFEPVIDEVQ